MLTLKMKVVDNTLRAIMHSCFHPERLQYIYDGKLTEDDIIIQVLVECCKYAHDTVSEKQSLRAQMDSHAEDMDVQRMQTQRSNEKILQYRKAQYEHLKSDGMVYDELLPPDMNTAAQKLEGYQYNQFQFWEIKNVHSMKLVRHIVNRSIIGKNFSSYRIEDDAKQYLEIILELEKQETLLFSSMALFTLEWKYSFEFMYTIVSRMEETGRAKILDLRRKVALLCGTITTSTELPLDDGAAWYVPTFESRMLIQRRKLIDDFLTEPSIDEPNGQLHRFREGLIVMALLVSKSTYEGIPLREWFVKNTDEDDWTSVFDEYNVFQVVNKGKTWTRNRVRYLKSLYAESTIKYHFPQKRS